MLIQKYDPSAAQLTDKKAETLQDPQHLVNYC
jgi:hypothetical protein